MYFYEILKSAFRSIVANKVRALLTTLGIIIGISAVIAMVSIGQGAQQEILNQVQGLGSNTVNILPVANFSGAPDRSNIQTLFSRRLDRNILDILENEVIFREIIGISPQISQTFDVSFRSRSDVYEIAGVSAEYPTVFEVDTTSGRFFSEDDDAKLKKVAVLGAEVVGELFGESEPLNKEIRIDGSLYRVIGVLDEQNREQDQRIYVPLNTAGNLLTGDRNFSQISVKVENEDLVDSVASKIEDELLDFYRIPDAEDANFTVITSKEIVSLVSTITSIFTTLLASIAGISLLVGGIGIMNIMLVSVTERTKEIGLRKAVGATQAAILGQFLMEAVVLTVIGGIVGTMLGILGALAIGQVSGIPVQFSVESVALATSVSAAIGITFGFYPAFRAARLNPIDALRYE